MPIVPNEVLLGSFLGSCSVHKKLELGERLMQEVIQIYPLNTEYHILFSNMYVFACKQEMANSLRKILKSRGIRKIPETRYMLEAKSINSARKTNHTHKQERDILHYVRLSEGQDWTVMYPILTH
ncbi:hypothetical protein LguiB_013241 [Lonicera macranthoides]